MKATQRRVLDAVEAGHTTLAAIGRAAGLSSTSNVSYHLRSLAVDGHIILRQNGSKTEVDSGTEFCAGWDLAARLAGNPDA